MNSITDHLHMHLLPLKTNCSCHIHIQSPHERMRCSPQAGHCLTPHKHSWGVHRLISLRPSLPRKPSDSSGEGSSLPRLPHFICQSQVQAVSCVSDLWIQIRRPRGAVRIWSFARVAQRAQRNSSPIQTSSSLQRVHLGRLHSLGRIPMHDLLSPSLVISIHL